MQCQSQLYASTAITALEVKAAIQKSNIAWFANLHPFSSDEVCMQSFDDIDCMTLNRFYNNYLKSNGDSSYNLVLLGVWTVDLKNRLKFLTNEPENLELHRMVLRGSSHRRPRPDNSERFGSGSIIATLAQRSITGFKLEEYNWLGFTW